MRTGISLALGAATLLASAQAFPCVGPALAMDLNIKVRGKPVVGTIPPKSSKGQDDTIAIASEGTGETEFRVGDEIAAAVASGQEGGPNGEVALRVLAQPGKGGLQGVRDVLARPDIDFGIAPALILERAAATDGMANLRKRLAYVTALYVEEVHLLAKPAIASVADLEGKTVSLGAEGGSTETLGRELLAALGVRVVESNLDARSSVAAIRDGRIDAALIISGKPVESIQAVAGAPGIHLVPIPMEKAPDGFLPTALTEADYPGLVPKGASIGTLGVQNVLYGYDWPRRSARGKVGELFLSILMYRLPELQVGVRHPKWREVNVAATIPGWSRLPAMQAWLDKAKPKPEAGGGGGEAEFEAFLRRTGTKVTGENREGLYQDFLRWRKNPMAGGTR